MSNTKITDLDKMYRTSKRNILMYLALFIAQSFCQAPIIYQLVIIDGNQTEYVKAIIGATVIFVCLYFAISLIYNAVVCVKLCGYFKSTTAEKDSEAAMSGF
jgi:hypothetical protein